MPSKSVKRSGERPSNALRCVRIARSYIKNAKGSCLMELGDTKIICTASVEDKVPPFLRNSGRGWITAEYGMLPGSTAERMQREASRGRQSGRTVEIQRLIGRSLRAAVDLSKMGERTIWIDCDVIQADGGTRTAGITGSFVALLEALWSLKERDLISEIPVSSFVAATSVGIIDGEFLLDLDYSEDSKAEVDMNVVMTSEDRFIEVQGTAESSPFSETSLKKLILLAKMGTRELFRHQAKSLGDLVPGHLKT